VPTWTTTARPISGGRRGTIATLVAMRDLARKGAGHPAVIEAAQDAVRSAPERNDIESMRALLADVRHRMRYTNDPLDTELVKAPWVAVQRSASSPEPMDCDDASVLLSSYLGAVGIPSKFVVVATNPRRPREFTHVYVEGRDKATGRWVPMDPIVRKWDVGESVPPEAVLRREEFPVAGREAMSGFGDKIVRCCRPGGYGSNSAACRCEQSRRAACEARGMHGLGDVVNDWLNPFYSGADGSPVTGVGPIPNAKAALVLAGVGWLLYRRFVR